MKDCTYYDLLGVSMNATDEEIHNAKNFLVKKFHPDANIDSNYDTTTYMQNVLEAYRILSNPKSRRIYDRKIRNSIRPDRGSNHAVRPAKSRPLSPDFAPFWEAANKVNELLRTADEILKPRIFSKMDLTPGKLKKLSELASEVDVQTRILKSGEIPMEYWFPHAINWLLFQWSQHRDLTYPMLFSMYDSYLDQYKSTLEQKKIQHQRSTFLANLERLLEYQYTI